MSARAAANDFHQYFTYLNPDRYLPSWRHFYESSLAQADAVRTEFDHEIGIHYGDDERQILNIYRPADGTQRPVIIFFHGGRWREGHPDFYDHLGAPWVRDGAVFVSAGYRLEPDVTTDESINDVIGAIAWVVDHAAEHGIDPHRIIVAGHSAGAHMAVMAANTDWAPAALVGGTIRAVLCLSAPVDLQSMGMTADQSASLDPTRRLVDGPPVLISYGVPEANRNGDDPMLFRDQGEYLAAALRERGFRVDVAALADTDHIQSAAVLADRDSDYFRRAHALVFGA